MKNKGIVTFLIFLVMTIVGIIVYDFVSKIPDNLPANPYELDVNAFTKVDTSLIRFKESRNFKIDITSPTAISYQNNRIYLAGDKRLQIIEPSGKLLSEIFLDNQPRCIFALRNIYSLDLKIL